MTSRRRARRSGERRIVTEAHTVVSASTDQRGGRAVASGHQRLRVVQRQGRTEVTEERFEERAEEPVGRDGARPGASTDAGSRGSGRGRTSGGNADPGPR